MAIRRRAAGFSLIELLVVMAVLGILAMATLPLAEVTQRRERERELKRALWEIRDAIDAYKRAADAGQIAKIGNGYPPTLATLSEGVPDATASGQRRYFLRKIPHDPFAPDGQTASQSWGLRSYASSPDRPEPGADVFDVFSQSDRIGLDGMALRQW